MAPAMISVRGTGHCDGTLRKQIAMACFRFVLAMLGSLQKETETLSRWKNLSEAASPGAAAPNQARTPLGSRLAEVRPVWRAYIAHSDLENTSYSGLESFPDACFAQFYEPICSSEKTAPRK